MNFANLAHPQNVVEKLNNVLFENLQMCTLKINKVRHVANIVLKLKVAGTDTEIQCQIFPPASVFRLTYLSQA